MYCYDVCVSLCGRVYSVPGVSQLKWLVPII